MAAARQRLQELGGPPETDEGKEPLSLRAHSIGVTSLALSVDGKRQTIKVWDLSAENRP